MTTTTPTRPPFDPELAAVVDGIREVMRSFNTESLAAMRTALAGRGYRAWNRST